MPIVIRRDEQPATIGAPRAEHRPAVPLLGERACSPARRLEKRERRTHHLLRIAHGARRGDMRAIGRDDEAFVDHGVGFAEHAFAPRLEVDEEERDVLLAVLAERATKGRDQPTVVGDVELGLDGEFAARRRREIDALLAGRVAGD
jgi:hypothetical protein